MKSFTARSEITAFEPSRDKSRVAVAGKDFFQIVDTSDFTVSRDLRSSTRSRDFDSLFSVSALAWGHSASDSTIALGNSSGGVLLYDIASGSHPLRLKQTSSRVVHTMTFSNHHSGHILYVGSGDGIIRVWDVRASSQSNLRPGLRLISSGSSPQSSAPAVREISPAPTSSQSQGKLVAIFENGTVQRWDVRQNAAPDRVLQAHTGTGLTVDWHPSSERIVTGGRDSRLHIYDLADELPIRKPEQVFHVPLSVARARWAPTSFCGTDLISVSGLLRKSIYVLSTKRPHVPIHTLKSPGIIGDVAWKDVSTLWSVSKTGELVEHDLKASPYILTNLPRLPFSWAGPTSFLTAVTPSTKTNLKMIYNQPTQDMAFREGELSGALQYAFTPLARSYVLTAGEAGLSAACRANALAAAGAGRFRTSQVWRVIAQAVANDAENWKRRQASEKGAKVLKVPDKNPDVKSVQKTPDDVTSSAIAAAKNTSATTASTEPATTKTVSIATQPVAIPIHDNADSQPASETSNSYRSSYGRSWTDNMSPDKTDRRMYDDEKDEIVAKDITKDGPQSQPPDRSQTMSLPGLYGMRPWSTPILIERAVEHAFGQGDLQFCAVIATLLYDAYPEAFTVAQVKERMPAYVEQLQRARLFAESAEFIATCRVPYVRKMALIDTQITPMCGTCGSPLSEESGRPALHCRKCKAMRNGCSLCLEPIRGLALSSLACGHIAHMKCLHIWVHDEGQTQCPTGCGQVL